MTGSLPPIEATVLVAAVDGLPARLRKKLDDAAGRFAVLVAVRDGERYTIAVDDATTVTLVTVGGVVRSADAVTCTCLLAPNCLHRAGVLTLAPISDGSAPDAGATAPGIALPSSLGSSPPRTGPATGAPATDFGAPAQDA